MTHRGESPVSRYGQMFARQNVFHAAGFDVLVDFGGEVVIVTEGFIDLSGRQLRQAVENFFRVEAQLTAKTSLTLLD